jgi:hypothetical protein
VTPNPTFRLGFSCGFEEAMRVMYPDAETFLNEDKQATDITLTSIALRELAGRE